MRKVVKRPDGHEEAIEGTPEEIREYERIVENDRVPKQKKAPELIKGRGGEQEPDATDSLREILEEIEERNRAEKAKAPQPEPEPWPWPSTSPIWITPCSLCLCNPCACRLYWDSLCGRRIFYGSDAAVKTVTISSNGTGQRGLSPFSFDSTFETVG